MQVEEPQKMGSGSDVSRVFHQKRATQPEQLDGATWEPFAVSEEVSIKWNNMPPQSSSPPNTKTTLKFRTELPVSQAEEPIKTNCVLQTPHVFYHFITKSSVRYLLFPSFSVCMSLVVRSALHTLFPSSQLSNPRWLHPFNCSSSPFIISTGCWSRSADLAKRLQVSTICQSSARKTSISICIWIFSVTFNVTRILWSKTSIYVPPVLD